MARFLCLICRFASPQYAVLANIATVYLRCLQGVPGAPTRTACLRFEREPGADDDATALAPRLRYPALEAIA